MRNYKNPIPLHERTAKVLAEWDKSFGGKILAAYSAKDPASKTTYMLDTAEANKPAEDYFKEKT